MKRVRVSRPYLARRGKASRRSVAISFWLSEPATVVFRVDEVAPACRYVGKFIVRAKAGRNVVRFRGRLDGRTLALGTYRLTVHPRGQVATRLAGVTVVIVKQPPGPAKIAAERARNTCPGRTPPSVRALVAAAAAESEGSGSGTASGGSGGTTGEVAGVQTNSSDANGIASRAGGLGSALGGAAETVETAARAVPPVLFALAGLAVLLLALAAMPQPVRVSRTGAALVHHRGTLALAGGGVMVAAVLSFMLLA